MPTALSVTAPLLLAAVLVVSAIGKLRAPDRARAAFTAMAVPARLDRPWIARAHPWGEIALALLLLVLPGPLGVAVAVAALLLMLVYLVLVIRALRSPVDVDCACFGALGGERVTASTVWRNAWLTALGALTVWVAADGSAVAARVAALNNPDSWWLISVLAAVVTVGLVFGASGPAGNPAFEGEVEEYTEADSDYIRSRTPAVPVELADGSTVDLLTLSKDKAQLLIFVSEGCGSCNETIASVSQWRADVPQIAVRLVVTYPATVSRLPESELAMTLHDVNRWAARSLGTTATPSAVLLGTDGLLAGGPVVGSRGVPGFVEEIREQLRSMV